MRRRYLEHKRRHLELWQPVRSGTEDAPLREALIDDGVVVVRRFLPDDVVKGIVDEVRPSIEALAEQRYTGTLRTLANTDEGLYRLYGVEESLSPLSRVFFQHPRLEDLANSMTVTGMHSKDRYLDFKCKVGGRDPNVDYHIDHWKLRFKAFLLLEGVTEDQAPFVYVTGSHRESRWRTPWDWGYQHREAAGAVMSATAVARLRRRYGFEERVITGDAGDVILAITRGIHRGTVLRRGSRLQLVNLFAMNGPPEYAD